MFRFILRYSMLSNLLSDYYLYIAKNVFSWTLKLQLLCLSARCRYSLTTLISLFSVCCRENGTTYDFLLKPLILLNQILLSLGPPPPYTYDYEMYPPSLHPPPYTPAQSQPANYSPPPPYPGCTGKWTPAGGTGRELSRTAFDLARAGEMQMCYFKKVQYSTIQ